MAANWAMQVFVDRLHARLKCPDDLSCGWVLPSHKTSHQPSAWSKEANLWWGSCLWLEWKGPNFFVFVSRAMKSSGLCKWCGLLYLQAATSEGQVSNSIYAWSFNYKSAKTLGIVPYSSSQSPITVSEEGPRTPPLTFNAQISNNSL